MQLAQTIAGEAQTGETYVLVAPDRLDFLIVLIGVVVGLSIGRLVTFGGQVINNRDVVKWHPTFLIFLVCCFLFQIFHWWSVWDIKESAMKGVPKFKDLSFLSYFRLLLAPIFLYGATAVLCKDLRDTEEFSMKEHFTTHARIFYLLVAALIVTVMLQSRNLWGTEWGEMSMILRGIALVLVFIALIIPPRLTQTFHLLLSAMILGVLVYFIYIDAIAKKAPDSAETAPTNAQAQIAPEIVTPSLVASRFGSFRPSVPASREFRPSIA